MKHSHFLSCEKLNSAELLTRTDLEQMFLGACIRVPGYMSPQECADVVAAADRVRADLHRQYAGKLNIGALVPSHWDARYVNGDDDQAWAEYFQQGESAKEMRGQLFASFHPLEDLFFVLEKAWGSPVQHYKHPRYKRALDAGQLRTGAPRIHYDSLIEDVGVRKQVLGQAGVNVYLANADSGGDLRVYSRYGPEVKDKPRGNYDFPRYEVAGYDSVTVPCRTGDMIMAPNAYLHEVTELVDEVESNRLVLSFHLVWLDDDRLYVYS